MAKLPEKVGKYKILSQVGKGGMGVVYAAEHPTLKRKIILKKLTIRDKEFRERFRLEADLMMDLRSDYIVDMYDHFREGSSYYIAMEFIEGITLEQLILNNGPLQYSLLVYIMSCTARAISYIHDRGITHRDIKPSNIYISKSGDVKLGDFGIASSASRNVKITDSGSAMGTPAYMAPEQFHDSSSVDKRADIFSLGVTLYESLTGGKPFRSEQYTELKKEISRGRYPKIFFRVKSIPFRLRWIITRALFVRPSMRQHDVKSIEKYFHNELKKTGAVQSREQLAALAYTGKKPPKGKLTEIVGSEEKNYRPIKVKTLAPFIAIFLLAAFFYSGALYKILLSSTYGGLNLSIIPMAEDGFYSIYSESMGELKKVKSGAFDSKGNLSLYLKEGSYRFSVESGSNISWRSVYVSCFKDTRGKSSEVILLSSSLEEFPLQLNYTVKDRFSRKDLTTGADVEILLSGQWETLNDDLRREMKTNRNYGLRFSYDGYEAENYPVDVSYYQTSVDIDVLLTPKAAELEIPHFDGVLRINGSDKYFSPDTLRFESLDHRGNENFLIRLLPGKYIITIEISGVMGNESVVLESGKHRELRSIKKQENNIKIELD